MQRPDPGSAAYSRVSSQEVRVRAGGRKNPFEGAENLGRQRSRSKPRSLRFLSGRGRRRHSLGIFSRICCGRNQVSRQSSPPADPRVGEPVRPANGILRQGQWNRIAPNTSRRISLFFSGCTHQRIWPALASACRFGQEDRGTPWRADRANRRSARARFSGFLNPRRRNRNDRPTLDH